MSEIPEDVLIEAQRVVDGMDGAFSYAHAVAAAILAERERAAKMADGIADILISKNDGSPSGELLRALAGAIRAQGEGK